MSGLVILCHVYRCNNLCLCKVRLLVLVNNLHVWLEGVFDTNAYACDTLSSIIDCPIVMVFLQVFVAFLSNIWLLEVRVELLLVKHFSFEGYSTLRNKCRAKNYD